MDLMPEASSAPPLARKRYFWRSLTCSLLFLPLYLGSQLVEAAEGPRLLVLVMGYAGLLFLLVLPYEFFVLMRQLDELQQRIQVTALALGFGAVLVLLTVLGINLEIWNAGSLPEGIAAMLATMALPAGILGYYIALHIVKRRYE